MHPDIERGPNLGVCRENFLEQIVEDDAPCAKVVGGFPERRGVQHGADWR